MSDPLTIQSHRGPYTVTFPDRPFAGLEAPAPDQQFLVDAKVAELYADPLEPVLTSGRALLIEATEEHKSLDRMSGYVEALVQRGVRRGHTLVAIGGGILQDITCFLAATMFRGLEWQFHPTTLLAQADSCIGSKSSINVGAVKNILGTFTPPKTVTIAMEVLDTLEDRDLRSGIGEVLKVHAIDSPAAFDRVAADYDALRSDRAVLREYIRASLEIKQRFIELDEYDKGPRNVLNYGHSFGHAIESATAFAVPHGVAVTIGMDLANFAAVRLGRLDAAHHERMHPTLRKNYAPFAEVEVPFEPMLSALRKDKKNTGADLMLILPDAEVRMEKLPVPADDAFRAMCAEFLASERTR